MPDVERHLADAIECELFQWRPDYPWPVGDPAIVARVAARGAARVIEANEEIPDPVPTGGALALVLATYGRQQLKHGRKGDSLHRSTTPNLKRLRVLLEEVGEVAAELDDDEPLDLDHLRTEVAQVAAVALAWLVGLEPGEADDA